MKDNTFYFMKMRNQSNWIIGKYCLGSNGEPYAELDGRYGPSNFNIEFWGITVGNEIVPPN